MGALCQAAKPNDMRSYSTKSIKSQHAEGLDALKFTTKVINQSKEEALLLFVDEQSNVERNEYLYEVGEKVGRKLQEYLDVKLEGKKMSVGACLVVNISMEELTFTKVAFLCIKIWESDNKGLKEPLQEDIERALDLLKADQAKSVCITNFNTEFGLPSSIGNKTLARAVINKTPDFQSITIAVLKEAVQSSMIEAVKKEQSKNMSTEEGAEIKKESFQSIRSEYY